jgi:hypothetical protein
MADFLSKDQYSQTTAAKKPGATYSSYRTWVTKTRAKRAAARNAPALPPTPMPSYPAGSLMGQAQGMVQPQYNAALQSIIDSITRSTKLGQNAISGYTSNYLQQLPAIQAQIKSIYAGAKNEQGQVNAGLQALTQHQNAQATGDLAAANAGAGGTGAGVAAVQALGQGSLAAGSAYGGSTMERLIGQGAANQAYAAKLPAYGAALGQQTMGQFLAAQQQSQADQTSQLAQQLPGWVQSAYGSLVDQQQFAAQQAEQARQFNASLQQQQYEANLSHADNVAARLAAQKAAAEKADPNANLTWPQKMQAIYGDLVTSASNLAQDHPGSRPGQIVKGLSYGQIRRRLNALVKGRLGPNVPPAVLKMYVDQALIAAGWVPPKLGSAVPPAAPGGLTGPVGGPQGPQGPQGPVAQVPPPPPSRFGYGQ